MMDLNIVDLLNPNGFNELFERNLRELRCTHIQAYNAAEEEVRKRHNHNKYSSYDSFRKVRNRRIKKH